MRKLVLTLIGIICLLSTLSLPAQNRPITDLFDRYSWLSGIVNPNNCGQARISEYQRDNFRYLFIRQSGTGKLYFQNGKFLCENTPNYDCINAYELNLTNRLLGTWNCGGASQCTNEGQIFFQNCGGRTFYLIRTSGGRIYDPYLADGVSYTPVNGQNIKYSFRDARISTPCTNAERTVLLTCVEVVNPPADLFSRYPWLSGIVSPTSCSAGTTIFEYTRGAHTYVAVNLPGQPGRLYLQDGRLLCQNTPTRECTTLYGLGSPISEWNCPNAGGCTITITNRECRAIQVFDENNNLLGTIEAANLGIVFNPMTTSWTDPRPLAQGATRTYIFKEGNLELGRQTASCNNANITVVSDQVNGCTDVLQQIPVRNTGCKTITVEDTNGGFIATIPPNQSIALTFASRIYIFKVDNQIIEVLSMQTNTGEYTIDSGGCSPNNNSFLGEYPFLASVLRPGACNGFRAVEVYPANGYSWIYVRRGPVRGQLYLDNGTFYCTSTPNYDCLAAYKLLGLGNARI